MSRARIIKAIRSGNNYYVPVEPTPPWREEDEQRWARWESLSPKLEPQPESAPEPELPPPPPASVISAESSSTPDPAPEPEEEPAPLVEVVDAIYRVLPDYLSCSNHQRVILALWIVHTYCFEVFPATPYLNIYSPETQSGKTLCLQLLRMLCHNSWMPGGGLTATRLMDNIAKRRPTLLLDDWHTAFRPTEAQSIIGFLNAGFAEDSRYAGRGSDGSEDLDIYCPKAFAGSASLPGPLADRSIPIVLQRQKPSESFRTFCSGIIRPQTESITKQLRLWFKDYDRLHSVYKHGETVYTGNLPGFSLRQKACALPLLTIARLLGAKWTRRARVALRRIFDIHTPEELSTGRQLLHDIRAFFFSDGKVKDKVLTANLLEHLNQLNGRPWSRDQKGKPLNPERLRYHLRDFSVCRSSTQWIAKEKRKGFSRQNFAASWDRYLTPAALSDCIEVSGYHSDAAKAATRLGESGSQLGEIESQLGENTLQLGENNFQLGENEPQLGEQ